jgi:hypothetical protein
LTKSALSFIISSCLGVFSVLLTKSALPFIISSCLGVFCCWQSQHCPWTVLTLSTEDTKAGWYYKGQYLLCTQQKTPRQDDMIKDNADFVNNTEKTPSHKVSTVLYHIIMAWCLLSVVDKVSTALYHIIMPWCLLLLTKSALSLMIW